MIYQFEWDPLKASSNYRKHGVSFDLAATVFRDPNALSIYDEEHSMDEDRWITLGITSKGQLLVVHHTFRQESRNRFYIRVISSRKATNKEIKQYNEQG